MRCWFVIIFKKKEKKNIYIKNHAPLGPLEGQYEDPETRYQHSWWCENRATVAGDCVAPRMDGTAGALPHEQF